MRIPHKLKQKEGWLYWDFAADQQRYFNYIEIFVKNEIIGRLSDLVYHAHWHDNRAFETLEIAENTGVEPIDSFLNAIKKELYLIAHFDLFGFELRLKSGIPPMPIISIPITVNYLDLGYDLVYTREPAINILEYRLSKTSVTDAWYQLISKVAIKVET